MEGVSVLGPTFCRTSTLSEVIACYLNQDYQGPSELVIYNDFNLQHLTVDLKLPENKSIKIYNTLVREETLGHKRNAMLKMATYNIITFWDDDDIYLPHRLSTGFNLLEYKREATREPKEWRMLSDGSLIIRSARPFGTMTLLKTVIDEVGGFPNLERLQDVHLVNKLVYAHKLSKLPSSSIIPSTIYRLHNVLVGNHVTDAPKTSKNDIENDIVKNYIINHALDRVYGGFEPTGEVIIKPELRMDYFCLLYTSPSPRD
jgi:glycosyltransferase involved in cell wall biosynthesis